MLILQKIFFTKFIEKNFYNSKFLQFKIFTFWYLFTYTNILVKLSYNNSIVLSNWFTKKKNLSKLYVCFKDYFFSPGIMLQFYTLKNKFLKNKLKLWSVYVSLYKKIFKNLSIINFKNFFYNKKYCFRLITNFNILVYYFIFKLCFLNRIYFYSKKKSSIKKWITKKYNKFLLN